MVAQITAVVALSNSYVQISAVALVRPQEQMPNNYLGVISGQQQYIDSILHANIPPKFLIMRRENVDDSVWGNIVLNEYVDASGDAHSF